MLELNRSLDADCLLSLDHDESDIIRADVEANELVNEIYAYCVFKLMWFSISFLLSNYAIFSLCQKILDINSILTDVWFTQNRRGGGAPLESPWGLIWRKNANLHKWNHLLQNLVI